VNTDETGQTDDPAADGAVVHEPGPDTDPSAPFVVELPNGQRLEIGDVPPGTIVEIATWRGNGAPDARTERMVIAVTPPEHQDPDAGSDSRPSRRLRVGIAVTALLALVAGLVAVTPIDVAVPSGGDGVLGGGADTAIVVTRPVSSLEQGLAVLVEHPQMRVAVLGRVSSVSGDSVLVRAGEEFVQVGADDIVGDVVVVLPFLGRIFTALDRMGEPDRPAVER